MCSYTTRFKIAVKSASQTLVPVIVRIHPSGRQILPGSLGFTKIVSLRLGDLWCSFAAMELTTILNRCHRFRGFVYEHARFSTDRRSMAHPEYLFRSLANVVRNAIRYAAQDGPILVSAANGDGAVSIMVSDNGPGVPESELEEIFKPFYPEFARQRQTGGVGLGLAIVKSCVQACGGTVVGRNRSPNGLEVEIRLPAANN